MFAGLWSIIWTYALSLGLVTLCVLAWLFSVALQAELASIPLIGPWLANNIKHIREWAVAAALVIVAATAIYAKGVANGEARIQAKWDAAAAYAAQEAKDARSGAERSVKPEPTPRSLHNDRYNRDNRS